MSDDWVCTWAGTRASERMSRWCGPTMTAVGLFTVTRSGPLRDWRLPPPAFLPGSSQADKECRTCSNRPVSHNLVLYYTLTVPVGSCLIEFQLTALALPTP